MDWNITVKLINVLIWPYVVLLFLFLYRKPLSGFIAGLGQRITKFSAFNITVEMAALPASHSQLSDANIPEQTKMIGGEVYSTHLSMLFEKIGIEETLDYLLVDIKDGRFWFVSRLYIFTVFLKAMRGLKCIVFVQSDGKYFRRILGLTDPQTLIKALQNRFTWLKTSLEDAINQHEPHYLGRNLPSTTAGEMIGTFIQNRNMQLHCNPEDFIRIENKEQLAKDEIPTSLVQPTEWIQLGESENWEHTYWLDININKVSTSITATFFDRDDSQYIEKQGISNEDKIRDILSRKSPFIALVNSKEEFKSLIERQKLTAIVGENLFK